MPPHISSVVFARWHQCAPHPNGILIGSAIFAQLKADCCRACLCVLSLKNYPLAWGNLDPYLLHFSFGPSEFTSQTASQSVQLLLYGHRIWMAQLYSPGGVNVHRHVTHPSFGPHESTTLMASGSFQPFLYSSQHIVVGVPGRVLSPKNCAFIRAWTPI